MSTQQTAPTNIDEYIAAFPPHVQELLEKIRATITHAVPDAEETIRYQIPTFLLHGTSFIHFAAFAKHISVYPAPPEHVEFEEELSSYRSGKGTAKFPLNKPIPFDLIGKIAQWQAKERGK